MVQSAWRLASCVVRAEWREHGRTLLLLGGVFVLVSLALGQGGGARSLRDHAFLVSIVAPFACAAVPASVIHDQASGLVRLVATHPLSRAAYPLLRMAAVAAILLAALLPVALLLVLVADAPLLPLLASLALVVAWSAAGSVFLGLLLRGPAAATGVWLLASVFNLLGVLSTRPHMPMDDLLVRARHALPGPAAVEMLGAWPDPWLLGAALTLALEALVLGGAAALFAARGWRHAEGAPSRARAGVAASLAAALLLPFLLPASGGVS